MAYLLDANVFITAANTYYGLDIVPAFWSWLNEQASAGTIASTDMIYDEIVAGKDDLAQWAKTHKDIFCLKSHHKEVTRYIELFRIWAESVGYQQHVIADNLNCADPFLVGVAAKYKYTVVTLEVSAGSSRKKIKIPDMCKTLGIPCKNTFEMMRNLRARLI